MPKAKVVASPVKSEDESVRVNLIVPMAVRKRWKTAAVEQNRSMSEMIVEAVNAYLDKSMNK